MSAMMSRPDNGAASASTELTHTREELSPHSDRGVFFNLEYDRNLQMELLSQVQYTMGALYELFAERIDHNDRCLELATINRHPLGHMRRVTHAAVDMALALEMPEDEILASMLAGSFHDIGYEFPEGSDPAKLGKESHKNHPIIGAERFTEAIHTLRLINPKVAEELSWWTDYHTTIADHVIRYHSNGSAKYDPLRVLNVAKLYRIMDKGDNTHHRIYYSHLLGCADSVDVDPKQMSEEIRLNEQGSQRPLSSKAKRRTLGQMHESLDKLDSKYEHRLVPFAITEQKARLNTGTGEFEFHYQVDPDRISHVLQARCGVEKFLSLFDKAYGSRATRPSMRIAAEAMHGIRNTVLHIATETREKTLKVVFHFPDNHTEQRSYMPYNPS